MNTKKHRILAMLLALVMVLSTPLSVFAEGDVSAPESIVQEETAPEAGEEAEAPAEEAAPEEISEEIPEEETQAVSGITAQPQDAEAYANDEAVFTVGTAGEVKSYQWQFSKNGSTWYNYSGLYGGRSDTLTVKAGSYSKYAYRCEVSFADGSSEISETAKVVILASSIKEDPKDLTVERGKEAELTVEINGTIASVQWQISYNNGRRWTNLSQWFYGGTSTLRFIAGQEDDGALVRAIVSTKDGKRLSSAPAKLTVVEEVKYPAQSFTAAENVEADVTVSAPEGAFPEGTTMAAETVEDLEAVQKKIDEMADVDGVVLAAVEITFTNNGEEIQPLVPVEVTMSAENLKGLENLTVVHIPDEEVEPEDIEFRKSADAQVKFSAEAFSVYAIIGEPEDPSVYPYRMTYEFYNSDGTPYEFTNAAGEIQTSQILKDGEILEDVGIPTIGSSQNAKFIGWYVVTDAASTNYGAKCEVNEAKSVTANGTIKLKAKMQGIINVYFVTAVMKDETGKPMARSIVTVKQVEFTAGQTDPITINVSSITTDAPTTDQAVIGWNRDEAAANGVEDDPATQSDEYVPGVAEGTNGVITLYPNGSGEITDVMMFPAITRAAWVFFHENDGGTGGGASYTKPVFVQVGGKATKPTDPHRTGYDFGGWYTEPECTNAFDFANTQIYTTTHLYAKWNGDQTTYTVIIWVQRTSDSANLPTDGQNVAEANRTYDFYEAHNIPANTGGTATVANRYKQLANNGQPLYTLYKGHVKYSRCDADKTVSGNASTVLNVYYDRDVMTIHWRYAETGEDFDTWYGLYGARLSEAGKSWKTPANGYKWRTPRYSRLSYQDSFEDFDYQVDTSLIIYRARDDDTRYDYYFYTENLDGTWKRDQQINKNRYTDFTLSEKYTGFHVYQYSHNGTNWSAATVNSSVETNGNFYVRYARNVWDLSFRNGAKNTAGTEISGATLSLKFETALAGQSTPTPTYPVAADADHYQFIGWFADNSWTTMVTFTELTNQQKENYTNWYGIGAFVVYDKMPNNNLVLYAGYALKGWDCALDPNGGTFTNPEQAGLFWLNYGEYFSSDIKQTIVREGYSFQGWMLADVPKDADGNLVILGSTTDSYGHRQVTNFSNWNMTEEPWEFSTPISGATALIAKWFYLDTMKVVYDAGEGDNPPTDKGAYSDHATTVAFHAPTAPANKFFLGWDIQGTETVEKLVPGTIFEVNSDYAVGGIVTLVAVYGSSMNEDDPVPVTNIDWYANNKTTGTYVVGKDEETGHDITETQLTHVTDDGIQLNQGVAIRPSSQFANYGYTFLGWAKLHKTEGGGLADHKNNAVTAAGTGVNMDYALTADNLYLKYEDGKFYVEHNGEWIETTQVAADEHLPYDDLYAVWKIAYFYVFHSATGKLEAVELPKSSTATVNIAEKISDDTIYGGYYKAYGAYEVTDQNKKDAEAAGDKTVSVTSNTYDGSSLKYNSVRYWTKANAYNKDNNDLPGTAMIPAADEVYYLKEVPNIYLGTHARWVYDTLENNEIIGMYLLTVIDDMYYDEVGYEVITEKEKAKIVSSFSYLKRRTGETDKVLPTDLISRRGYIGILEADSHISDIVAGDVSVKPYWITLDGVTIKTAGYTLSCDGDTLTGGDGGTIRYEANSN